MVVNTLTSFHFRRSVLVKPNHPISLPITPTFLILLEQDDSLLSNEMGGKVCYGPPKKRLFSTKKRQSTFFHLWKQLFLDILPKTLIIVSSMKMKPTQRTTEQKVERTWILTGTSHLLFQPRAELSLSMDFYLCVSLIV